MVASVTAEEGLGVAAAAAGDSSLRQQEEKEKEAEDTRLRNIGGAAQTGVDVTAPVAATDARVEDQVDGGEEFPPLSSTTAHRAPSSGGAGGSARGTGNEKAVAETAGTVATGGNSGQPIQSASARETPTHVYYDSAPAPYAHYSSSAPVAGAGADDDLGSVSSASSSSASSSSASTPHSRSHSHSPPHGAAYYGYQPQHVPHQHHHAHGAQPLNMSYSMAMASAAAHAQAAHAAQQYAAALAMQRSRHDSPPKTSTSGVDEMMAGMPLSDGPPEAGYADYHSHPGTPVMSGGFGADSRGVSPEHGHNGGGGGGGGSARGNPSTHRWPPPPSSSSAASAPAGDEIATRSVQVELKRFYLDLRRNSRGRFLKIAEAEAKGTRSKVILPGSGVTRFKEILDEMVVEAKRARAAELVQRGAVLRNSSHDKGAEGDCGSQSSSTETREGAESPSLHRQSRQRHEDEADAERSPRAEEEDRASSPSPRGASEATLAALDAEATNSGTVQRGYVEGRYVEVPATGLPSVIKTRTMRCESKKFYLDLLSNTKGRYLKISQSVSGNKRSNVVVPASGIAIFRDAIVDTMSCDEPEAQGRFGGDGGSSASMCVPMQVPSAAALLAAQQQQPSDSTPEPREQPQEHSVSPPEAVAYADAQSSRPAGISGASMTSCEMQVAGVDSQRLLFDFEHDDTCTYLRISVADDGQGWLSSIAVPLACLRDLHMVVGEYADSAEQLGLLD